MNIKNNNNNVNINVKTKCTKNDNFLKIKFPLFENKNYVKGCEFHTFVRLSLKNIEKNKSQLNKQIIKKKFDNV